MTYFKYIAQKKSKIVLLLFMVSLIYCKQRPKNKPISEEKMEMPEDRSLKYKPEYIADTFDYPFGKPNGKGYYNAQKFGEKNHLGDDWNGVGGGNTDLGDAVYSIANGFVASSEDVGGGWGNVIRIIHQQADGSQVESLYAHLNERQVEAEQWITKGTQIGTIGTANGSYLAHLHLEIRTEIGLPIGGGYSEDTTGYTNPTKFIKQH